MELNIVLRGQSNAQLLLQFGAAAAIQSEVESYLGFDGSANKVNLIATQNQPNGDNTINSGTSFLTQWLSAKNGNWMNGWTNNTLEQGFVNELTGLPADQRAAPTAILFVHNEYDSADASLQPAEFQSAVRYDAGQVRAALGQGAATTPYMFVDVPYGEGTDTGNQAIKQAQQSLSASAAGNGHIAARANDLDMNWDLPNNRISGYYGDGHMSPADANELVDRIARSIADQFASYAQAGSPIRLAGGKLADTGPQAVQAQVVKGSANKVLVTVRLDGGAALAPLSATAAAGVGWSVVDHGAVTGATGAAIQADGRHVLLTFAAPVAVDGGDAVYYGYGIGRTAQPATQSQPNGFAAEGNAVYDRNGLPIWASAYGVAVAAPATAAVAAAAPAAPDTLVLHLSADSLRGSPQFIASLDGAPLGPARQVTASHGAGQTQDFAFGGAWSDGAHTLQIAFASDPGAPPDAAPALYLGGIDYDGAQVADGGMLRLGQHVAVGFG